MGYPVQYLDVTISKQTILNFHIIAYICEERRIEEINDWIRKEKKRMNINLFSYLTNKKVKKESIHQT
jgi:hypothetical protein